MDMSKLKRCPFCGGEATLVEDIYNDQLYNYVICTNDDCNANTGRCSTEDEAITKWNNRSNWHTGTPTEEGWYLCKCINPATAKYVTDYYTGKGWEYFFEDDYSAWQKITPFEEGEGK